MALSNPKKERGFTLIELLVVIAIIGLLASIVLAALGTARARARDSERLNDMKQLQLALEEYATANNGNYPSTGGSNKWAGICSTWNNNCSVSGIPSTCTNSGPSGYIPGLAPTYIGVLPTAPVGVTLAYPLSHGVGPKFDPTTDCYIYTSNGTDYKLEAYYSDETYPQASNPLPNPSALTNPTFSVYSLGATNW